MIKLTRALWIIPVAFLSSLIFRSEGKKIKIPWFILLFVVAMLVNTYLLTDFPEVGQVISKISKKAITLTMFFIGASLSISSIKTVGYKALLMGFSLWLIISIVSLSLILA